MGFLLKWLSDPRFWIILLLGIRLEQINLAPLDAHAWRQCITLGVARNFLEWDNNIFHPRHVIADSRSGIFAQEFPIFNYLIYLGWSIFGTYNWVPRMINLLATSLGLWWFYGIIRRLLDDKAALAAMVIFGVSIAFSYGRKSMPDTFALSLVLGGVAYSYDFLDNGKWKYLLIATVLMTLGMLSKIPAVCAAVFLLVPFLSDIKETFQNKRKLWVAASSFFAVFMTSLWYFVWVPYTEKKYGSLLFFPTGLVEGWKEIVAYKVNTLERFTDIALQSQVVFAIAVLGLILLLFDLKKWKTSITVVAYCLVFFYFILKTGRIFSTHAYYIIPFVPAMAVAAGYAIARLSGKFTWALLFMLGLISTVCIYRQKDDFFIPWSEQKYLRLEELCAKYIPPKSRVLTSDLDGCPKMLYMSHHIGWTDDTRFKDTEWVKGESTVGMDYLIIEKERCQDSLPFPRLHNDNDFAIYKTKE